MTRAGAIRPWPRRSADGPKYEPTTGKGPAFYQRVIAVIRKEPELDLDAIVERFGLTYPQARHLRGAARALK